MNLPEYIASIANAANTILEGMAVTFSHLFREPVTVQYPDKTAKLVVDSLPPRYRGLLEVQMDICTGCRRCERTCPIEVISIELTKDPATKKPAMSRFDIDIGKCMFCGLCVETCRSESTGAIRHTREFEGAASSLDALVFRFVPEGTLQPLYKAPKERSEIPVGEAGPHARDARERALKDNPPLFKELRASGARKSSDAKATPVKPTTPAEDKKSAGTESKPVPPDAKESRLSAADAKATDVVSVQEQAPEPVREGSVKAVEPPPPEVKSTPPAGHERRASEAAAAQEKPAPGEPPSADRASNASPSGPVGESPAPAEQRLAGVELAGVDGKASESEAAEKNSGPEPPPSAQTQAAKSALAEGAEPPKATDADAARVGTENEPEKSH